MKYGLGSIILASAIGALASPTQNVLSVSKPRPLVIWHGLGASVPFPGIFARALMSPFSPTGDSYNSSGMLKIQSAIEDIHPGIFIHSVYVDPDSKKDMHATMVRSEYTWLFSSMTFVGLHSSPANQYGNVDEQVELVARQLKDIPSLSDGFDAIGFSQGSYCTESRISGTRC